MDKLDRSFVKYLIKELWPILLTPFICSGFYWLFAIAGMPPSDSKVEKSVWVEPYEDVFEIDGSKCQIQHVIRGLIVDGHKWQEERTKYIAAKFIKCENGKTINVIE